MKDWSCTSDEETKICLWHFGRETFWKAAIWKTEDWEDDNKMVCIEKGWSILNRE